MTAAMFGANHASLHDIVNRVERKRGRAEEAKKTKTVFKEAAHEHLINSALPSIMDKVATSPRLLNA